MNHQQLHLQLNILIEHIYFLVILRTMLLINEVLHSYIKPKHLYMVNYQLPQLIPISKTIFLIASLYYYGPSSSIVIPDHNVAYTETNNYEPQVKK